ncbi:MAG: 5'-nucleotidase C-terminal domain-containing protein [Chloroflexi bacterium]|nr:5'-nucleotidase C-terminal domain-containing protein [Chloroflexota bacterium]
MNKLAIRVLLAFLLLISGFLVACSSCISSVQNPASITILHTNDIQGFLDNAPRLTTAINQVRSEVGVENTILVDTGDAFSGTLYSTLFHGEAETWFMNHDQYDAMNLGNHEFDKGSQWLADFIGRLDFPILNANFDFSKSTILSGKTKPWVIIKKDNNNFGLFGLTLARTRELSSPEADVIINNEIDAAKQCVSQLKKKGINKIIALTHMGWNEELELAKQVPEIDVIVGGHTGTVPDSYPTEVSSGKNHTLLVQAGNQNQYLGKLNVDFDGKGVIQGWEGSQLITIDKNIEAESAGATKIAEYQVSIGNFMNNFIGKTSVDLDGDRTRIRKQETNLGNIVADSMLNKATVVQAKIALINGGGIRASIPAGDVSLGDIMKVLPFNNYLVVVDITGAQLVSALENGVSLVEKTDGRFLQVAGLRYAWAPAATPGNRIKAVEVRTGPGYQPVNLNSTYRAVITNFLASGGDGYTVFKEASNTINLGYADYELLTEYIKANSPLITTTEGRITPVNP